MDPAFWRDKRVFITGHTGFKGSWLSLWLQSVGAHVIGFSLAPPSNPNLFTAARIGEHMVSLTGDVCNLDQLKVALTLHKPDIVLHLAAQSLVRHSYAEPVQTFATNIMGTANLLEAVRHVDSVRVAIVVTSDKCYENQEWAWGYRENEPMGGYDPYSASKGCAELITSAYQRSYFSGSPASSQAPRVAIASVRAGNVIGGGDWALDRLIPDIMRSVSDGKPVLIRNPNAIRPWQHVLEPLAGYLRLSERAWSQPDNFIGGWNFGPADSDARPVLAIVQAITKQWGDGASWHLDQSTNPHEANYLKLDCSKARAQLDWQPKWNLDQTLSAIVVWYKAWQRGDDMRQFSLDQINRYASN
jgi:CDP-glucose 4,6-dehydratase